MFTPTVWVNGSAPGISAEQLNRIEAGIADLDLATISTPVTATAPVISLPSTALKSQLSVKVEGNTKNQLVPDTWATSLDGWTSTDDSIVSDKYRLTKVEGVSGYRDLISIIDFTKYYMMTIYGTTNSDTDGSSFTLVNQSTAIKVSNALTKTQSARIGLILQPSDMTGSVDLTLYVAHVGSGYTEYYQFFVQEISSAEYAEGLTVLMNRYHYRTSGTKSTLSEKVTVVGKNLFDKRKEPGFVNNTTTTEIETGIRVTASTSGTARNATYLVTLEPNTQYTLKAVSTRTGGSGGGIVVANDISTVVLGGNGSTLNPNYPFTTPSNGRITLYFYATDDTSELASADYANIQLELGATATPYEPYTESVAYIPAIGGSLPNGVKDEFDIVTGVKTQRISDLYTLLSTDVEGMATYSTNVDYARVRLLNNQKIAIGYANPAGNFNIGGKTEIASFGVDDVTNIGKFVIENPAGKLMLVVAKGVTLATAQTLLAGQTLNYQLAVPIVTEIEGMGQLVAEPSGSIIIEPAVKFEAKPATGVLTIPAGWANIVSIESVRKITMNADGSLTYEAVTPSTNNTTTITLPAGYDDTKFYEAVYLYDSSLSTIPDCTYSYPTNVRGEIDSIGDMASQTVEDLDELNDFTIAQLIALNSVWKNWTPTLTWTTADPASITTVARYITIGNTCFFNFMCTSADGNAATQLSISLPVAAKDNYPLGSLISFTAQELVDTTWSNPLAYLEGYGSIAFRVFSAATDAKTVTVVVTGQYEVSVA